MRRLLPIVVNTAFVAVLRRIDIEKPTQRRTVITGAINIGGWFRIRKGRALARNRWPHIGIVASAREKVNIGIIWEKEGIIGWPIDTIAYMYM